ncbi:MAG: tRNA (guanosine(37)-N1)-methyltransferase TrmD [Armatimonadetes bacterium]|nr:tRNA (guanosine(37)-N1)-methyltransferase TrmD [Armatimonadota bacterium]
MRIDVVTLFPEFFAGPLGCSVLGRGVARGALQVTVWNLRDFTPDRHGKVDDTPYGGGPGMVLTAPPFIAAVRALGPAEDTPVILFTPQGEVLNQQKVHELASRPRLILLCGHYEGVDERVRQTVVTEELSIGDYVLSGGEPAALVVIDAVARLLPGVLGNEASAEDESFSAGLLEYPQYTRPAVVEGLEVPEVLRKGHHAQVARWRRKEALRRTYLRRPELLARAELSDEDRELLAEIEEELAEGGSGGDPGRV